MEIPKIIKLKHTHFRWIINCLNHQKGLYPSILVVNVISELSSVGVTVGSIVWTCRGSIVGLLAIGSLQLPVLQLPQFYIRYHVTPDIDVSLSKSAKADTGCNTK